MPMFDRACNICGVTKIDCLEPATGVPDPFCPNTDCAGVMMRAWLGHANAVIGDEIDVLIKHGLCDDFGRPVRYTSREALKRDAERRGWTNYVEHKPPPGTDKSKHTSRWV